MKGETNMNDIAYTDAPPDINEAIERSKVLDISIDQLIKQNKKERITIMLDRENLDFFRKEAKVHGIPYQTMINNSLTATRSALQKQT
jgi:predicted DNA binding CopG/RHH family protein